jgi:hypothetical protein
MTRTKITLLTLIGTALAISVVTDLSHRLILNWVTFPTIGLALLNRAATMIGAPSLRSRPAAHSLQARPYKAASSPTLSWASSVGSSFIDQSHSLIVAAELLAELDSPQSYLPGFGLLGGGIRARYDGSDALILIGELSYAASVAHWGDEIQTAWSMQHGLLTVLVQ